MRTSKVVVLAIAIIAMYMVPAAAAEYLGRNIDGIMFEADAFSYSTGSYYHVTVEFDMDEATIYFQRGGHITVELDNPVIEDPHNISTFDSQQSVYWDLDVDGLD